MPTESAFSNPLASGGRILEDPSYLPQLSLVVIQAASLTVCYALVILFYLMFRSLRLKFHLFLSQVVCGQSNGISEQGLIYAGIGYDQDIFPTWKVIAKVPMTATRVVSESGMSTSEPPSATKDGAWNRPPSSSEHTPKQERGENRVRKERREALPEYLTAKSMQSEDTLQTVWVLGIWTLLCLSPNYAAESQTPSS